MLPGPILSQLEEKKQLVASLSDKSDGHLRRGM